MINECGFSLCQKLAKNKSNEISAMPDLINSFNIKNCIIIVDAMVTQRDIVLLIREKGGQYVLVLKANHKIFMRLCRHCFQTHSF
ncbi:MAG: transposase [Candidatus Bathyarchaeota archaeon]|nr:transposase [Candidatus Termiticorpusculum sp.]